MKGYIQYILIAILSFVGLSQGTAQSCVNFYFEENIEGDQAIVELKVDNFEDISTLQFGIAYTANNLELNSVDGNSELNIQPYHYNTQKLGYITLAWENAATPQTLADGSTLLTFSFTITEMSNRSEILIDPNNVIEISDNNFDILCHRAKKHIFNEVKKLISGSILQDMNLNCIIEEIDSPLSEWIIRATGPQNITYRITDKYGNYDLPVEVGTYKIEVLPPNDHWEPCLLFQTINITEEQERYDVSFLVTEVMQATDLLVNISSPSPEICENIEYTITYKNNGTIESKDTKIDLHFDNNLSFVSDNSPNIVFTQNSAAASIGNLLPGEEGTFNVVMNVDCSVVDGQAICTDAQISAQNYSPISSTWNGAIIKTDVTCENDSVYFKIENIGNTITPVLMDFIVVEDDVMFGSGNIDLEPSSIQTVVYKDNGAVYRIIAEQQNGFPNSEFSTSFTKNCSTDKKKSFDFIAMFANEDGHSDRSISCMPASIEAIVNDISAFPQGYRENHIIDANRRIAYTIFFENTTSDTIYNVEITSDIDTDLDIASIVGGPSSNLYNLSIVDDRKIKFQFFNIVLPPARTDNVKGYVTFYIDQTPNLANGTIIKTNSSIKFDDVEEATSQTFTHIIGENYIEVMINNENILLDNEMMAVPNPSSDQMTINVPTAYKNISYILYNMQGQVVSAATCPSNEFTIHKGIRGTGMYILEIKTAEKILGHKRIIFQ